jgi:undecaprenyl pyrophosphate synthase
LVRGTLEGLAEQILSGEFGTPQAAQMIQEKAMGRAGEATYMPRTELGQEYVQETADVLGQLPAMAPLAAEAGAIRAGLAGAAQAARAGGPPAVQRMGGQLIQETGRESMDVMVPQPVRQAVQQGVIQPVAAAATRTMEPVRRAGEAVAANIEAMQQRRTQQTRDTLKSQPDSSEVVEFRLVNDRVQADPQATEAIKQGFDPAVLGSIKASRLNILKLGKTSARFSAENRPSQVIGDSMMSRVNFLINVRKDSGKQVDRIAQTQLRGQPVNFDQPMSQFISDLADIGVSVERGPNGKFKVNLKGSDIEGDRAGATLLNRVLERLGDTDVPDAYGVHTAKRYIDTQVDYGKRRANPLTQQAERVVKKLRRNLNTALGDAFPEYREQNTKFSDALTALDEIQEAVGKKVNFDSDRAGEAFGTALRKVLSNYGSRNQIIDAIDSVETVAKKYGLKINDDLINQIIFVNEIDRMFGAVAPGSFKGQIEQALQKGSDFAGSSAAEKAVMILGKAGEAMRGINEENAIKAIEEILRRQAKEPAGTQVAEQ